MTINDADDGCNIPNDIDDTEVGAPPYGCGRDHIICLSAGIVL